MSETAKLSGIAQWRAIRRVYSIYAAVATEFGIGAPPYKTLDHVADTTESQVIEVVEKWLAEMDERIQPHQFRATLERPDIVHSEEKLRGLVQRYLNKPNPTNSDRDKLQYLLTQYAFVCAPPSFRTRVVGLGELAEVLEPVLGECPDTAPEKLQGLTGLVDLMPRCGTFEELEASVVIPGRRLKAEVGAAWSQPAVLLALTHFNYCLRCTYARLLGEEVRASHEGLAKLQAQHVTNVDCTALGLSANESVDILRECLQELSTTAPADYAVVNARSEQVRALRATIESTLQAVNSPRPAGDERFTAMEEHVVRLVNQVGEVKSEIQSLRRVIEDMAAARQAARLTVTAAVESAIEKSWASLEEALLPPAFAPDNAPLVPAPIPESEPPLAAAAAAEISPMAAESKSVAPAPAAPPAETTPADAEIKTVAPAAAAAPAPRVTQSPRPAPPAADFSFEVTRCIAALRRVLGPKPSQTAAAVKVGAATVVLSTGELEALYDENAAAALAHRAITARILLLNTIEKAKKGETRDAERLLEFGRRTLAELQQVQTQSGASAPTVLATTARQLRAVLQHAEASANAARAM